MVSSLSPAPRYSVFRVLKWETTLNGTMSAGTSGAEAKRQEKRLWSVCEPRLLKTSSKDGQRRATLTNLSLLVFTRTTGLRGQIFFSKGKKGSFVKRPFLVGHNDKESGLFRFLSEKVGTVNEKALSTIDEGYACPPAASATYRVTHGVKAWRYRYHGIYPNQEISPIAGAYHSAEIPLLFGTSSDTGPDTSVEAKMAKSMRHAWAEFAKDPVNGLTKLGWPTYEQSGKTLVQLGLQNNTDAVFEYNKVYDEKCPTYVTEALIPEKA